MNSFIFQSRRDRYDLEKKIVPNLVESWTATRYREKMKPNDLVFFWLAGDSRGIYGWGRIVTKPYIEPGWTKHGVDVRYERKFAKPILSAKIEVDPMLRELLILRVPQSTNFLLQPLEAQQIARIIKNEGEVPPPELDVNGV